jgi:hypothetical protein
MNFCYLKIFFLVVKRGIINILHTYSRRYTPNNENFLHVFILGEFVIYARENFKIYYFEKIYIKYLYDFFHL